MSAALPLRDDAALPDSATLGAALERDGYALTAPLLRAAACQELAALYDSGDTRFRSTVVMARHGFGRGEYKYFDYPLPGTVARLREALYARLAPIASDWSRRLGGPGDWPADLAGLTARCTAAGQDRPTPLLLSYGPGDYNCLHQDLYGEIHFPLQAIVLLDRPGEDFEGGELVLVEQRPRRQSRPVVVPLVQGAIAIVAVRDRPVASIRGTARVQLRHGVSAIRRGRRRTLGLIFHDAR